MIDYSNKSNFEIAKMVINHLPVDWFWMDGTVYLDCDFTIPFDPCNNPSDMMPIAFEYGIAITPAVWSKKLKPSNWFAVNCEGDFYSDDDNPLRSAAICFLKMMEAR